MYVYICLYSYMYTIYAYINICIHSYAFIHIHSYEYMHTFIYAYYICIYNDKCRFSTGFKTFWVVPNNRSVIDTINKLKNKNKAKSVFTLILLLYLRS